jgi:nucleotide-binding universal stress UspA family protein
MFKTIVVGVDGREGGRDALALASRLALVAGGKVVAARVLPFEYYVSHAGAPPYASIAERDAKRDLAADLASAAVTGRCVVVGDSSAARGLHRVAEAQGADLIVVGSTRPAGEGARLTAPMREAARRRGDRRRCGGSVTAARCARGRGCAG